MDAWIGGDSVDRMSGTVIPGGQRTPAELVDGVTVQEDATTVEQLANTLNFVGAAVTRDGHGRVTITTGAGGAVQVEQDGEQIVAAAAILNFTGSGVTVTEESAGVAEIAITGGGGGGSLTVTDGTVTVASVTTLTADPDSGMFAEDLGAGHAGIGYLGDIIQQDGEIVVDGTREINFIGAFVTGDTDPDSGLFRANISYAAKFPSTARYTADGSEGADFQISLTGLGIPQPNANYNAIVTGGGMADVLAFDVVQADNTTTHIHVISSAVLTVDDVLVVLIIPYVPV